MYFVWAIVGEPFKVTNAKDKNIDEVSTILINSFEKLTKNQELLPKQKTAYSAILYGS